jgi:hypothetical protein
MSSAKFAARRDPSSSNFVFVGDQLASPVDSAAILLDGKRTRSRSDRCLPS